jgi:hypothetical protein
VIFRQRLSHVVEIQFLKNFVSDTDGSDGVVHKLNLIEEPELFFQRIPVNEVFRLG